MSAQALDEEQAFMSHMCQEQPFADSDLANTCFGSRSCPSKKSPSLAASPTRADDQGLDGSMAVASDRGPTRQLGELAHERSGLMYGDQLPLSGVVLGDLRPASITASPWAASPIRHSVSPASKRRTSPNRRSRSVSAGSRMGRAWSRRISKIDGPGAALMGHFQLLN